MAISTKEKVADGKQIHNIFCTFLYFLCGGDFRTLILTNSMWIFKTLVQQKLKFFGGNHLKSCPVSDLRKN